jgi:hypothetical protein
MKISDSLLNIIEQNGGELSPPQVDKWFSELKRAGLIEDGIMTWKITTLGKARLEKATSVENSPSTKMKES